MRHKSYLFFVLATLLAVLGTACNKFVVEDVNYAYKIESVLTPEEDGTVTDVRHGITFNIQPFVQQEFEHDSTQIEEVRLIRNAEGFYFITANGFKHVYVMEPKEGSLSLENKIKITDKGLQAPAFNMRDTIVQLVNTENEEVYLLNEKGIQEEDKS